MIYKPLYKNVNPNTKAIIMSLSCNTTLKVIDKNGNLKNVKINHELDSNIYKRFTVTIKTVIKKGRISFSSMLLFVQVAFEEKLENQSKHRFDYVSKESIQ